MYLTRKNLVGYPIVFVIVSQIERLSFMSGEWREEKELSWSNFLSLREPKIHEKRTLFPKQVRVWVITNFNIITVVFYLRK